MKQVNNVVLFVCLLVCEYVIRACGDGGVFPESSYISRIKLVRTEFTHLLPYLTCVLTSFNAINNIYVNDNTYYYVLDIYIHATLNLIHIMFYTQHSFSIKSERTNS